MGVSFHAIPLSLTAPTISATIPLRLSPFPSGTMLKSAIIALPSMDNPSLPDHTKETSRFLFGLLPIII